MNFADSAAKAFGVSAIRSDAMDEQIRLWENITNDRPPWLDADDGITTINMATHVADTRAKLVCLDIGIETDNESVQALCDSLLKKISERLPDAEKLGGMIIKWNGNNWECIMPRDFTITAVSGDREIMGAIFAEHISNAFGKFTRLEYHAFDGDEYVIANKAFKNKLLTNGQYALGEEISLTKIDDWAALEPEIRISDLEHPLFAYFRMPAGNNIDNTSPLGVSCFGNAVTELMMLDVAVSRKHQEIEDSKHITFVGQGVVQAAQDPKRRVRVKLPRFVKGIGIGVDDDTASAIKEHVPTMLTDARIKDINFDLSMIGIKCGFSEGVFVLDGQTGMITATQVEANDRDTVQTIKADRDALKIAIERAIYSAVIINDLQGIEPASDYVLNFNFGDITYNYSEDKESWKSYVMQGWIPAWKYLVKFEGIAEEEARMLASEAAGVAFDETAYE